MNTTDDGAEPLGEAPEVPVGWVDVALELARKSHALQNAVDDIRVLLDTNLFRVPSWQLRNILDRHGL
jgi:hypothetical protein